MAMQAVSARRVFCGRKMQKLLEERFTSIHFDLRKGLSSSLERGGPQLTRPALNEEQRSVCSCLRASRNVLLHESSHDSPRQGLGELPTGCVCGIGEIKDRLQSHAGSQHSQGTTLQESNWLPQDNNAKMTSLPIASPRELQAQILQEGRGVGNMHMPSASTTTEAITILKNRQQRGIITDWYTFVEVLKRCLKQGDVIAVRQVHDYIIQSRMDKNPYVANTLLNAYIRCGRLEDARRVFDGLKKKTVVSWRIMIAGYAKNNLAEEALEVFNRMRQGGTQLDQLTCLSILKACASPSALKCGTEVHAYIAEIGLESDVRVGTALVQMYAKCGCITEARRVFEKLRNRDVITSTVLIVAYIASGSTDNARLIFDRMEKRDVIIWNIMIGAYAERGCGVEAYRLFLEMQREGFIPNAITYVSVLNAFTSAGALEWLKEVHSHAFQAGLESDLRVGNVLIHKYAKIGSIDDARLIFDRLKTRDVVTWNIMIGAYAESGCGVEAYRLFLQMQREGFTPDAITYVSILNASARAGALEWVKEVHCHALKVGLESDLRVGTALVHMYAKSGRIDDARLIFDRLKTRDVVTWNIMIGAFAESGRRVEAYELFLQMKREGFTPNAITYVSLLNASATAGDLEWVKEIHSHALLAGLGLDLRVGNALVHMYAKSGNIDDAQLVFDRMEKRDVVTLNVMIGGLGQHGRGNEALELFRKMNANGVKPNGTTFVALLSACCHAGLLDDGRRFFSAMTKDYGI